MLWRRYWYVSAYLGIAQGGMSPAVGRLPLDSGRLNVGSGLCPCLTVGDTVMVRLACMGVEACRFWRGLEGHGNALAPPLFTVKNTLHSGIGGGLGHWIGYGAGALPG